MVNLFLTRGPELYNGEGTVFSTNGAEKTSWPHAMTMRPGSYITPYTKMNCEWSVNLNVGAKPIKILEENIQVNL